MTVRTLGYYNPGDSWLHRRYPVTKLLALLWLTLAAFVLPALALPVMAVGLVAVAVSAKLLGPLVRSLRIPALLFVSIFVVNALFYPGDVERIIPIGPVGLSWEGIAFALLSATRILVVFLASILFLLSTLADDLLEALIAKGVNHRLAFVVLSAVQIVPRLSSRAGAILDAQQARGLRIGGSLLRRGRALVPLIGPIVLGSLIDVRERTFALEARAFAARKSRTAYRVVFDPPIDRWLRLLLVVGFVLLVSGALAGVFR